MLLPVPVDRRSKPETSGTVSPARRVRPWVSAQLWGGSATGQTQCSETRAGRGTEGQHEMACNQPGQGLPGPHGTQCMLLTPQRKGPHIVPGRTSLVTYLSCRLPPPPSKALSRCCPPPSPQRRPPCPRRALPLDVFTAWGILHPQ